MLSGMLRLIKKKKTAANLGEQRISSLIALKWGAGIGQRLGAKAVSNLDFTVKYDFC